MGSREPLSGVDEVEAAVELFPFVSDSSTDLDFFIFFFLMILKVVVTSELLLDVLSIGGLGSLDGIFVTTGGRLSDKFEDEDEGERDASDKVDMIVLMSGNGS